MKLWADVRRAVLAGEMSRRDACKKYNLNYRTIQKILSHEEPPGYRRESPREKPKLGPLVLTSARLGPFIAVVKSR